MVDDGGAIDMLKVANTYFEVHLFLVQVVSKAEVMLVLGDEVECENDVGEPNSVEYDVGDADGVENDVGKEGDVEEDDEEEEKN